MNISLIVSAYEQPAALEKVFKGLARQTRQPVEVFIADDGSRQETRAVIERWRSRLQPPIRHLWQPHEGFRKVLILNRAIAAAMGEYIVFTDGDCVPHPAFVADHAGLAEHGYWVQGRRCFVRQRFVADFEPGKTSVWRWLLARRILGLSKAVRWSMPFVLRNQGQRGIIGCNMAAWRDDLIAINGFDETCLGWGLEDSDLGTRLYNLGRPRKFVYGRAVVYHLDHDVKSRDISSDKRAWLDETLRTGKVRCEQGVQRYL